VREVWSEQAGTWSVDRGRHWLENPEVQQRINLMVAGVPDKHWFEYFIDKYIPTGRPLERVLTLGCGSGECERGLAKHNIARLHDAIDVAEGAIEKAKRAAEGHGFTHIQYSVGDLNQLTLEPNTYDVIFGISSIHHVAALEHLFDQVRTALKPSGYFFLNEFIGPSRFQWSDEQLRLANEILEGLPLAYRRSVTKPGELKAAVVRPTIEQMRTADPSEAIRSAEIVPLLGRYFDIVEFKGYGGSLLHLILEDIAGNFRSADAESMRWFNRITETEDRLIASGKLQHDFGVVVSRRKADGKQLANYGICLPRYL
jgi:ubiquinone/menaquinone biosynthesis C-methylase UbiE